ncbi:MAG: hypothetical protein LBD48_06790 [Treponema sp.]|jgi:hypothetical protein|nr:hypothetical protein [Treponema sp.]
MKTGSALLIVLLWTAMSVYGQEPTGPDDSGSEVQDTSAVSEFEEAVKQGNCSVLYQLALQQDSTELAVPAGNVLRRYTTHDRYTETYQTGRMSPRIRDVPAAIMFQIFVSPDLVLPQLVAFLAGGTTDVFEKVKRFHDWICDTIAYDTEMYFSGKTENQDYAAVLKKKKAVCSGYSNLMNEMCRLANIESIVINGYSKGFGYSGSIGPKTDHAWNAVHIGSKWYLVDVTWNAGSIDGKTFIKGYSTAYLFLDSRAFLYSHLPEKPEQQFYAPVLAPEKFTAEAYVPGLFFQYGLALEQNSLLYNNTTVNGVFMFTVTKSKNNIVLTNTLESSEGEGGAGEVWMQNIVKGERPAAVMGYIFPDNSPPASRYKGVVLARYANETGFNTKIGIDTFENDVMKKVEALGDEETITKYEFSVFKGAFFKVADNNAYYFAEDQFDGRKNNIVKKIFKLLDIPINASRRILDFNLTNSET